MKNNSRMFVFLMLAAFAFALIWLFYPYIQYLVVALLLAVSGAALNRKIQSLPFFDRLPLGMGKWRNGMTAAFLSFCFLSFLFIPLTYFVTESTKTLAGIDYGGLAASFEEVKLFLKDPPETLEFLKPLFDKVIYQGGETMLEYFDLGSATALAKKITAFIGRFSAVIAEILWVMVFYFFFNLYGAKLYRQVMMLLPLEKDSKRVLYDEFSSTMSVVLYGSLFNMFIQGVAFGILMAFFDGYNAVYLGVMAGILSIIPIVGNALVYIPVVIIELWNGHYGQALIIMLYSWLVMGIVIDNILRLIFLGKIKKIFALHYTMGELMVLFAMMAGITTVGFWGIIIGPAIVSLSLASLDVYKRTAGITKKNLFISREIRL